MKVTQEKLPASKIGLEIEIPAEISQKTYEKVIQDLARTASIPGFRKGKVPRPILLQRLGTARIKAAALEEIIQKCLQEAVEQEKIPVIGSFELTSSFDELVEKFQPGEAIAFKAAVDVEPEVTLGDYSQLSVQAEEEPYDPAQVDNFLEERRREQATLIPVEGRPAKMGDVAVVDFSGKFAPSEAGEGAEIPGAQSTDFQVEIAEDKFLPEFIEGINGMSVGETKEVNVSFPEDYGREDLAGKAAIFTITLKDLKEKELPELDDDFAQEVSEFATIDELRADLEAKFREKADKETAGNKEKAVMQELAKLVEVDLPETMIEKEVESLLAQTAMQLGNYGMDIKKLFTPETVPHLKERSRPEAITRIKQSLALEEIAKRESLQVDPEALAAKVKEYQEQLKGQKIDKGRLSAYVQDELLKDKAVEWLVEHAQIALVPKGTLTPDEESEESEVVEAEFEAATEAESAANP